MFAFGTKRVNIGRKDRFHLRGLFDTIGCIELSYIQGNEAIRVHNSVVKETRYRGQNGPMRTKAYAMARVTRNGK